MTPQEAIETIKNNWPDERYTMLREALELAIEALKAREGGENMNFGQALEALKQGDKVAREGWNGKDMYIKMDRGGDYEFSEILPFFVIKNVLNSFNTWVPSVSDLLAMDWVVVKCGSEDE